MLEKLWKLKSKGIWILALALVLALALALGIGDSWGMDIDKTLWKFIEKNEGLRQKAYRDTREIWTIGVGRNLEANPLTREEMEFALSQRKEISPEGREYWLSHGKKWALEKGITKKTARYLLGKDIKVSQKELYKIFGQKEFLELSSKRQMVLTDMMFNLGASRFRGFERMIKGVKERRPGIVAKEILDSTYARQLPKRSGRNATVYLWGE